MTLPHAPPPSRRPGLPSFTNPNPNPNANDASADLVAAVNPPPIQRSVSMAVKPEDSAQAKEEKRKRIRTQVAQEIMTTEQSYVKSLRVLQDLYITPLSKPDCDFLTQQQCQELFSNVSLIAAFNEKFLKDVEARMTAWDNEATCIADIFHSFSPFFKMYTQYVANHEVATQLLNKLNKDNKAFVNFCVKAAFDPSSMGLNLASLLITPIQRIPRYKLLLAELHRNTPATHPDYAGLEKALDQVGDVAMHINEAVKKQAHRNEVVRIQELFGGSVDLVSPSRRFLKQGPLTKVCRASDRKYEFFLFNDLLLYSSKPSMGSKYKLHRKIDINGSFFVEDLRDGVNRFQIRSSDKSFVVIADDAADKDKWLSDLFLCMKEAQTLVNVNSKGFTAAMPVWQSDHTSNECSLCDKPFSFFNRRHHCRSCGALVCDACSTGRLILKHKKSPQRVCDNCSQKNQGLQPKRLSGREQGGQRELPH